MLPCRLASALRISARSSAGRTALEARRGAAMRLESEIASDAGVAWSNSALRGLAELHQDGPHLVMSKVDVLLRLCARADHLAAHEDEQDHFGVLEAVNETWK